MYVLFIWIYHSHTEARIVWLQQMKHETLDGKLFAILQSSSIFHLEKRRVDECRSSTNPWRSVHKYQVTWGEAIILFTIWIVWGCYDLCRLHGVGFRDGHHDSFLKSDPHKIHGEPGTSPLYSLKASREFSRIPWPDHWKLKGTPKPVFRIGTLKKHLPSYQIALQFDWASPAQCFSINGSSIGWKSGKVPEPKADPTRKAIKCPMKQQKQLAIGPSRSHTQPSWVPHWNAQSWCTLLWRRKQEILSLGYDHFLAFALIGDEIGPIRVMNSGDIEECAVLVIMSTFNLNQPVKVLVWHCSTFWKQPLTIHFSSSVGNTTKISAFCANMNPILDSSWNLTGLQSLSCLRCYASLSIFTCIYIYR